MKDYISKNAVINTLEMMVNNIDEKYEQHKDDVLNVNDLKEMLVRLEVIYNTLPVKKVDDGTREDA